MSKPLLKSLVMAFAFAAVAAAMAGDSAWSDNFSDAKKAAGEKKLPILALFTGSDWCPWCMKLEKEVLSKKPFQDYASKSLILFKADFPRETKLQPGVAAQNHSLAESYKVEGYPTVLLIDAEGKVIGKTGYQEGGPVKYVATLKELLKKAGK